MQQIKQILEKLSLDLELSIAMCDKINNLDDRVRELEGKVKAQGTRIDAARTSISELTYKFAGDAYEARKASKKD